MIKRHYFYHFVLQDEKPRFANGIVIERSWFADPDKAWRYAVDFVCNQWKCDRNRVQCKAFNSL